MAFHFSFCNYSDIWCFLGRQDRCEAAKNALIALVPITVEVSVPYDLHRYIIGQKGKDVREMMTTYDVNIKSKLWPILEELLINMNMSINTIIYF